MLNLLSAVELELSAQRASELERRLEIMRQLRDNGRERGNLRRRLVNQLASALIAMGEELRCRGAAAGACGEPHPAMSRTELA